MRFPKIGDVAEEIYEYGRYLHLSYNPEDITDENGDVGGDCRLRIWPCGGWSFHTGDA